jgi:hypothetical protein
MLRKFSAEQLGLVTSGVAFAVLTANGVIERAFHWDYDCVAASRPLLTVTSIVGIAALVLAALFGLRSAASFVLGDARPTRLSVSASVLPLVVLAGLFSCRWLSAPAVTTLPIFGMRSVHCVPDPNALRSLEDKTVEKLNHPQQNVY